MSQVTYRANLSAKSFPFISQNWGRTVIVPQYDNSFNRQLASQEDADKDVGIPQIFYCHNVMPTQQGFQSIGYGTYWPSAGLPAGVKFTDVLDAGPGSSTYFAQASNNAIYVNISGIWKYVTTFFSPYTLTQATVAGVQYIYVSGFGCYTYNATTNTLDSVTLTALTPSEIQGITAAAGYMIAWGPTAVYWSSTVDPTDFTPSLVTGAGGGQVEAAKGNIVFCGAHTLGFIVYTTSNVIASLYSGNTRYPFNFREIVNSGGLSSFRQVTYDANSGSQYVYTTSGLQLVSTQQTQTILPEVTDFLAGQLFEDYDESTDTFSTTVLSTTLETRLSMVADRYLILSYGVSSYTHALIYDLATKRWGKLKIPHAVCFEYFLPTTIVTETPRKSIGFLQADGTLKIASFDVNDSSSNGVIALGKYQFVRQRLLQLDEINLENIPSGTTPVVIVASALDGKNSVNSSPALLSSSGLYRQYGTRAIGINHSLIIRGSFSLDSVVLTFNIHGKR